MTDFMEAYEVFRGAGGTGLAAQLYATASHRMEQSGIEKIQVQWAQVAATLLTTLPPPPMKPVEEGDHE